MLNRDLTLRIKCPVCGEVNTVTVSCEDFNAWQNGELIQIAFSYLSAEEREIIKTGICGKCWENMFEMA